MSKHDEVRISGDCPHLGKEHWITARYVQEPSYQPGDVSFTGMKCTQQRQCPIVNQCPIFIDAVKRGHL